MTRAGKAEVMLLTATVIWGSTFTLGKIVLLEVTPLQMVFVRFSAASLLVTAFAWRAIFPIPWRSVAKGVILGVFVFFGFVTQTVGLTITTASKSAFITGMMVIFVPLLQFMMERRAPKVGNVVGVAIVSGGLWLLTSPAGSTFNAGDALTVVCAVVFAVYIVYLDIVSREVTTMRLMFLQLTTNALLALIGLLLFGPATFSVSTGGAAILVFLTLFATVLTFLIQTRYQKDTTPVRAVVIFTLEPVFAAVIAFFVLGEGIDGALGGALIIGGVLISELCDSIPGLRRSLDAGDAGQENAP